MPGEEVGERWREGVALEQESSPPLGVREHLAAGAQQGGGDRGHLRPGSQDDVAVREALRREQHPHSEVAALVALDRDVVVTERRHLRPSPDGLEQVIPTPLPANLGGGHPGGQRRRRSK